MAARGARQGALGNGLPCVAWNRLSVCCAISPD
jgi:hypothetical protein